MMAPDRVDMRGIDKRYDASQVLHGVDFSARRGEIHALVGENGAGKSTLMRILAGVVPRDAGTIALDGETVEPRTPLDARRLGIRAVHQELSLVPHLDVTENLLLGELPTRPRGVIDWAEARREAEQMLAALEFGGIDVRERVDRLGISQRQMVEIAKALRGRPRVLILDEPSAVLSSAELDRLFAVLQQIRAAGTTVLYVSHRLDEVFHIADRITVLKDGSMVGTVTPGAIDQPGLIRMMVGRPLSEIYPARTSKPGARALELDGLSGPGFRCVSLVLARSEIVGVFGLVGSGRTELARAIFGATRTTAGSMRLDGSMFAPHSPADALRAGVAMLAEDRARQGLVMPGSVADNLTLASFPRISRRGVLSRSRQRRLAGSQVEALDIRPVGLDRPVRRMSGGNQQKVVFGKWLLRGAAVQILDEPTRGVDVATKVQIYRVIGGLADEGRAVLLISSELPEILGMSDRILVMREGAMVAELSRAEATEERLLGIATGVAGAAA
jgi:ribose transport system ATP-binding protein